MGAHSPGPWRRGDCFIPESCDVDAADGAPVATVWAERDIALAIAAPGLLAALDDLVELIEMDDEAQTFGTNLWAAVQVAKVVSRSAKGDEQ